ncbi:hypothetical protein [Ruminococcus flavefaciens]|uniref:hypothetical protein n=1 Tax=Ruminococcus flavefaciens TaxID=1265 RepID=UPI0026EC20EE|nr:hypothetical protein [Ruminococcus flavefaciens]
MSLKKFAAAAASVLLMFCAAGSMGQKTPSLNIAMTASADYEFEFIDEDDAEDILNDYAGEYEASAGTQDERVGASQPSPVQTFFISLIIGMLIGFVVVSIMRSSMKSVHKKAGATDYRKQDGFKLSVKTDDHLGTKVEKSPIARATAPTQNNISKK